MHYSEPCPYARKPNMFTRWGGLIDNLNIPLGVGFTKMRFTIITSDPEFKIYGGVADANSSCVFIKSG